jgi:DNA-binding beta-propeller fold protein YncE
MNDPRGLDIDPTRHFIYTVGAFWNRVYQFSYDPAAHGVSFVNEWRNIDGSNYAASRTGIQPFDSIRFPAVDADGNVYVGETWGCDASCNGTPYGYGVEKFSPRDVTGTACNPANAGTAQTTCAGAVRMSWSQGPQPPPRGGFNQQNGIALDPTGGALFVVDTFEQRVQRFDTAQTCAGPITCAAWQLQWGSRAPASPTSEGLGYPRALTYGDDGRVWVGDNNNAVLAFDPSGGFVHRFGSQGVGAGQFSGGVQGIRVEGGKVYATDVGGCRLQVFDETKLLAAPAIATAQAGTLLAKVGGCGAAAGQMKAPRGVAVNGGSVYVAESGGNRVTRWAVDYTTGKATATVIKPVCAGKGLSQPWGITWDPAKQWLYIGDVGNRRVVRMHADGSGCQVIVTAANLPTGMQFLGSNFVEFGHAPAPSVQRLYVSDNSRHIYSFDVTG